MDAYALGPVIEDVLTAAGVTSGAPDHVVPDPDDNGATGSEFATGCKATSTGVVPTPGGFLLPEGVCLFFEKDADEAGFRSGSGTEPLPEGYWTVEVRGEDRVLQVVVRRDLRSALRVAIMQIHRVRVDRLLQHLTWPAAAGVCTTCE